MTWVRTLLAAVVSTSLLTAAPVAADAGQASSDRSRLADVPTWNRTSPPVALRPNTTLGEVACSPAGTSCVAFGHRFDEEGDQVIAIQRWDGSTWRVETPPPGTGAGLVDVACSTPTDCLAIEEGRPQRGSTRRVAVRSATGWRWVEFVSPRPAAAFDYVSCVAATSCLVSGHAGDFVTFDGSAVHVLPRMPFRPSDVSCPTSTYCAAAGDKALFEWDGVGWTATPLDTDDYVWDVGCWAERACLALGADSGEPSYARSPDAAWRAVPTPSGRSPIEGSLREEVRLGLECIPNGECHLLRHTGRRRAPDLQLMTWTEGGWATTTVPPLQGVPQGLGCGPQECVVVDQAQDADEDPLTVRALHGDGLAWSRRPMVNLRGVLPDSRPVEAACPTTRDSCLVIGSSGVGEEKYVVRRTARGWRETAPLLEGQWDLDCWRPGSCVVAGWHDDKPRVAVLNAGRWQRQRALSPPWLAKGSMTGVSCVGPRCTYTGYYRARHDAGYGAFVARRDGAGWHAQRLGPLIEYDTWFHAFPSIDCPTATRCVVVTSQLQPRRGEHGQVPNSYEAVLEDGTWRWRTIGHNISLFDLDCADADHCVAGGSAGYPGLIMARGADGRWRRVAAATRNADFTSVSCPTSRACYVAGTGSRVRRLVRTAAGWRARETGPRDMTDIACWAPRSCLTFNNRIARTSR